DSIAGASSGEIDKASRQFHARPKDVIGAELELVVTLLAESEAARDRGTAASKSRAVDARDPAHACRIERLRIRAGRSAGDGGRPVAVRVSEGCRHERDLPRAVLVHDPRRVETRVVVDTREVVGAGTIVVPPDSAPNDEITITELRTDHPLLPRRHV